MKKGVSWASSIQFCENGYVILSTSQETVRKFAPAIKMFILSSFVLKILAGLEMVLDTNEDYVSSEIDKQKRKLKDMTKLMEQQHQLLRLIVQVRILF